MVVFTFAFLCGKDEVVINFLAVASCAAVLIKVLAAEVTLGLRVEQLVGHVLAIIHAVDLRFVREIHSFVLGFSNVWFGKELFEEAHSASDEQ